MSRVWNRPRAPRVRRDGSVGGRRTLRTLGCLAGSLALLVTVAGTGHAAVSVSRAEVNGSTLRLEGTAAPSRSITVDGVAMGSSDASGRFRVERSGFVPPPDCTVDVGDGSATAATARLDGCTVTSPPPPAAEAALSSLTLRQSTVVGGNPATAVVTLTAPAPSGGFDAGMSSSDTTVASVPASVTVPAGASSLDVTVSTSPVAESRFPVLTATAGGETRSVVLTVVPQPEDRGSISLARGCVGPCGTGTVTSDPPGVSCTFTPDTTSGTCGNVFFPAGTEVRLEARPADDSRFLGWEAENSCREAPDVTVLAGVAHICRPVFGTD